jgi:protein ImuB
MFTLAARLRSEPDLRDVALAVVEGSANSMHVVAASRRARTKGVRAGMSLIQARSLVPKLLARARDAACERTAQEALLEVAETFSPRIEDAGNGVVFFDVSGLERHFANERDLAASAIRTAEAMSMPARCGIAASKLAARVAAELPQSPTVVERGQETEFLAPLPLARLAPELEAAMMLERWGLTSIGDLARLPESEVASRLGELGRELHYAARGLDPRPLIPRALPPEFREGMDLEWPLVALESFLFIVSAALDRLSKRMEIQGFACRRLELTMMLDPDGFHARAIELPAPTRDVKTMLTLLRLDVEKAPPGAPVRGFSIVAYPDRPRRAQLSLFGPAAVSPEKLAAAVARLASMIGEDRIGMPITVDSHRPDRYALGNYEPPAPPKLRSEPTEARDIAAVRVLRPPVPIEVITRPSRPDEPGDIQIAAIEGHGAIRASSGPWQLEEGWWREQPDVREYWDVESENGVYRVYRGEGWYWEGGYD